MKFVAATNNDKKLVEINRILSALDIEAVPAKALQVVLGDEIETATTFEGNAYLKAKAACEQCGLPAIADDSGLEVDALEGAPGVYSARFGGPELDDEQRYEYLLDQMKEIPQGERTARFVSCVCCYLPNGKYLTVRGTCEGQVATAPSGKGGFGYDPIFMTEMGGFAELSPEQKDSISHRGQALRLLSRQLQKFLEENHADQ